jgi:hypothetical protein
MMDAEAPMDENAPLVLSVSGTASDISTGQPLEEIKITIHAYEKLDGSVANTVSKTTYTDNKGRFTISADGFTNQTTCLVTAEDPDGIYEGANQEIKISWSQTSMLDNVFFVNDCDFYLERKK